MILWNNIFSTNIELEGNGNGVTLKNFWDFVESIMVLYKDPVLIPNLYEADIPQLLWNFVYTIRHFAFNMLRFVTLYYKLNLKFKIKNKRLDIQRE